MKLICKRCGDTFEATKYEKKLIDEGFITIEDVKLCNDCFEVENETFNECDERYFSDIDPVL